MDELAIIGQRLDTLSAMYHAAWKKYGAAKQAMDECDRAIGALEAIRDKLEADEDKFAHGMRTETARFKWYKIVSDLRKTAP